jgi:hypothetical protein
MALPTLLRIGDSQGERADFAWEHVMSHRALYAAMAPLTTYSVMPYLPLPDNAPDNDFMWRFNHQSAHNDALTALPSWPYRIILGLPAAQVPSPLPIGVPNNQNLVDTDFADQGRRRFWTFVNHDEHYAAQIVLPEISEWIYPFG